MRKNFSRKIKRTVDFLGSFLGLVFLFPVFLVISVLILLDSNGAPIIRLKRISQSREFLMWKFRTMFEGAQNHKGDLAQSNIRSDSPFFKMENDPRVTKFGKILRKTRLDELPQLLNVFKGDMSLVGPRPHEPEEVARFSEESKILIKNKAGITGMAQVTGAEQKKPFLPFSEEVRLEKYYSDNWSLGLDFKIILKTIKILLTDKSAW
ncbi:MAG: Sugar transferase, probable phospho-glucosyltransferase [Parcubacteria group bacterium GW2011_GWA2_39_18]|nr:MAG: Sugar transferase, probable phospho-glucosyltransferase [Parcubacteria group bacterium GW2011_GWA2_39_18]